MTKQISDVKINKKKRKVLKHLSKVGVGILSFILMTSVAGAIESTSPVKPSEVLKHAPGFFQKGKEAVKPTLKLGKKVVKSKTGTVLAVICCIITIITQTAEILK